MPSFLFFPGIIAIILYSNTIVYAENSPSIVPVHHLVIDLLALVARSLLRLSRYVLVSCAWLLFLPLATSLAWHIILAEPFLEQSLFSQAFADWRWGISLNVALLIFAIAFVYVASFLRSERQLQQVNRQLEAEEAAANAAVDRVIDEPLPPNIDVDIEGDGDEFGIADELLDVFDPESDEEDVENLADNAIGAANANANQHDALVPQDDVGTISEFIGLRGPISALIGNVGAVLALTVAALVAGVGLPCLLGYVGIHLCAYLWAFQLLTDRFSYAYAQFF